jgi:hypothetical protein
MLDPVHSNLLEIVRGYLLEGTQSTKNIKTELYKLNVYGRHLIPFTSILVLRCCPGEGSFFKPHVDTPRSEKMFGSLVIVFPTPHEGGALHLRHSGHEWTFDSGKELASKEEPSIGYVAFFSDIEHEVAPVISGHRVTLTYNLYFDDDRPITVSDARLTHPQPANEGAFRKSFKTLLEDPEFLADGGSLGFGLRHVYPIENNLEHVYRVLKGSDAVVYQGVRALGFEPVLYLYYQDESSLRSTHQGVIIDKIVKFPEDGGYEETNCDSILLRRGGILVSDPKQSRRRTRRYREREEDREQVEWITPVTEFNRQKSAYLHYGNDSSVGWAYGDVCLIVRIGKAGDRLEYPTVAELKKEYKGRDDFNYDEDIEEDIEEDVEEDIEEDDWE